MYIIPVCIIPCVYYNIMHIIRYGFTAKCKHNIPNNIICNLGIV